MATSRTLRRIAPGGALVALGAVPATTTAAVRADAVSTATAPTAPGRAGRPTSAVDRVADFYGACIDVLYDCGRSRLADALRTHYLTAGLRQDLARWEAEHHRDGVLRAKGVPVAWKVVHNDSGMGHCWTRATLTWQDSADRTHRTRLMIQSDLATLLISGIRSAD
ncbi:hypothetical protein [Streptomyces sp. S.PB5]|uniref:hypothetical protein n=1 Tax=Streptomyces sp. S.PB5 TaxID=3020844 RepID=UPI0025B02D1C|nr:hypothetical protein [Streptomyces sp. S.PB5]MDN3029197.1 hypothetical protein [Streptomyces sp. S.PB5]